MLPGFTAQCSVTGDARCTQKGSRGDSNLKSSVPCPGLWRAVEFGGGMGSLDVALDGGMAEWQFRVPKQV